MHHLPVLNRQKRMTGLISLGDIALKGEMFDPRAACQNRRTRR